MAGDFNPLHVDRPHAAGSHFGGVVAHAGLVASAAIGLGSMDAPLPATVGLLEMSWKFVKPVMAGDSIRSTWRLARKRPLEGRAWGVAVWQVEVENQHGVKVAEGSLTRLVATRASEAAGVVHSEELATAEAAVPAARRRRRRGRGGRGPAEAVFEEQDPEPETADVPPPARRTRRRGGGQSEPPQPAAEPAPPQLDPAPVQAGGTSSRRRRRRRSGGGNGGGESAASTSEPGPAPQPPAPAQPAAASRSRSSGRLGSVLRRLRGGS